MRLYLFSFLLLLIFPACKEQHLIQGEVVNVADGDTFTLIDSNKQRVKVRMYGIDAPERGQGYSNASKKYLSSLLMHKRVTVQIMDVDQYRRVVGLVMLGEVNVNEAVLSNGFAWHYTAFDNNPNWTTLEKKARIAKKGLWAERNPQPPWRFRRDRRAVPK